MRLLIILAALAALVGCGGPPVSADCRPEDLTAYAGTIETQITTYRQQVDLTAASPRMSMGTPLQRLLDIQTATRAIAAPPCLAGYHGEVIKAMEFHQRVLQDFASQAATDAITAGGLAGAKRALDELAAQLPTIKAGSVPPTATPVPPTPSAEVLTEPEPGAVQEAQMIWPALGVFTGATSLCPADTFDIVARQQARGDEFWVQIKVTNIGPPDDGCKALMAINGRVAVGDTGWLPDSVVFAP
jgi:hypothetical protein